MKPNDPHPANHPLAPTMDEGERAPSAVMPPPPRVVPDADATPPAGLATTAWTVVFTPEGDGPGVIDRLSLTLKVALRRHGPRAVACGPVGTGAEARALDVLRRRARRREHREPAPGGKAELREWMERVRAGG